MKNYTLAFMLVLSSCADRQMKNETFFVVPVSEQNISITSLPLERITLDSITSSFNIESGIIDENKVYYLDKNLCELNIFDTNGKFIERKLGSGNARNEITASDISGSTFCNNNNKLFLYDGNGGCHLYNKDVIRDDYFRISYNRDQTQRENNPENNPINYTNCYEKFICRNYKNSIYFNVHSGNPKFSFFIHTDKYFTKASNILELDIEQKKLTNLLAKGYPESYTKDPYSKLHFVYINFDIDMEGNFYTSYEADPYIYVYDNAFKNIASYGLQGKDMYTEYTKIESPSYDNVFKTLSKERKKKGHYTWLEYVDETKTLFRSYLKSGKYEKHGLQIYKDGILIGDVEVPKLLKVMGYIHPYYYSYVIADEEGEEMVMYRFKL